jgi:hypothetical protein
MRPLAFAVVLLLAAFALPSSAPSAPRTAPASSPAALSDAERVVQEAVDALNRRDVDAFMAVMSPTVVFYEYPADTVFAGEARLRAHYQELFEDEDAAGLHAEIRKRIVKERFVIDEEAVTGLPGEALHVSVVIYEVVGGRIQNAWFMN